MTTTADTSIQLLKNSNQALGIGQFAVDFISGKIVDENGKVYAFASATLMIIRKT